MYAPFYIQCQVIKQLCLVTYKHNMRTRSSQTWCLVKYARSYTSAEKHQRQQGNDHCSMLVLTRALEKTPVLHIHSNTLTRNLIRVPHVCLYASVHLALVSFTKPWHFVQIVTAAHREDYIYRCTQV